MNRKTVLALLAAVALCIVAACNGNDNANTNTNTNANRATATPTATPTPANTNTVNWNQNREEYNKNANNYRAEAKNRGETIGDDIEDGWIHFKARGALLTTDDLRDSTINVDVTKGAVTLRGSVANAEQKKKAEDVVKKLDGVKSVVNKLEIKPDSNANKNANANANSHAAANANKK